MKRRSRKWIRNFFLVLIMVYVFAGLLFYFFQDLLLFHPVPLPANHRYQFSQPFEEVNLNVEGRNLHFVKFKPEGEKKGLVLFFHGNMKNVEHYKKYPGLFTSQNMEIWIPDYPGFGKSTGERNEENMNRDALRLYELAIKEIQPENIIIYGKSMGTGVASYTASLKKARQLILETPYYSIDAMIRSYAPVYPVSIITRYSFPVNRYLPGAEMPVTIFHGTKDEVIPYRQAVKLKNENDHVELVSIAGGKHNDLSSYPAFTEKLRSLLNKVFVQTDSIISNR